MMLHIYNQETEVGMVVRSQFRSMKHLEAVPTKQGDSKQGLLDSIKAKWEGTHTEELQDKTQYLLGCI